MDLIARAIVVAAIILGAAHLVRGLYPADRYTMTSVPNGAFRLDRLTGSVIFCDALLCRALPLATPVPGRMPAAPGAPPTAPRATGT